MDCFKTIFKNEGPLAFYKGILFILFPKNNKFKFISKGTLSPLLGVGAAVSIQFGVNEMCKRVFKVFN